MKVCYRCKVEKDLSEFHIDRKNKDGRRSYCKPCAIANSTEWYAKSEKFRQSVRNSGLRKRFGITNDDYFEMLKEQNGVCAICETKPEGYLHVDHCHETGEIRGLLCKPCNLGLGNFRDNRTFLSNAIEYLG